MDNTEITKPITPTPKQTDAPKADPSKDKPVDNKPADPKNKEKPSKQAKKKDEHVPKQLPSMVSYEKHRKKKKIILAVLGVSFVGVAMLSIIAFLGRYSGNFTVKLDGGIESQLTMSDNKDFSEGTGTTYLRATGLEYPKPISVDSIPSDDGDGCLDKDEGGSKNYSQYFTQKGKPITLVTDPADAMETDAMLWTTTLPDEYYQNDLFFCYTFFVKNSSSNTTTPYMVSMSLDNETYAYDSAAPSLSSLMRVRVYENMVNADGTITHDNNTYAKARSTPLLVDGVNEYREKISYDAGSAYYGQYSSTFTSSDTVFSTIKSLDPNESMRYTVLLWLEGSDPECVGSWDMKGASISFSMHFYGQETGATSSSSSSGA